MTKKTTDILAYITWVGLIIAFVAGDREASKFHLNQALVIWLAEIVCIVVALIPVIRIVAAVGEIFLFICWVMGLVGAITGTEKPVPVLGAVKLLK